MKILIQRVSQCRVTVEKKIVGEIKNGLLVLLGVCAGDIEKDADYLVDKIIHLRIFEDEQGKMNKSIFDKGFSIIVVSQFTLYADCKKGRRPSFSRAAKPDLAIKLYDYFKQKLVDAGIHTESGKFQAMMDVSLINSGPVTIMIESKS